MPPTSTAPSTSSEYARVYDKDFQPTSNDFFDVMLNGFREHVDRIHFVMELIHKLEPASILDMPCGWGIFGGLSRWTRGYAPDIVWGVDMSQQALEFAAARMQYDRTIRWDLTTPMRLPRQFELVLCMELLEHVHDVVPVVHNACEHSSKRIIFSTPVESGEVDGTFHVRHITDLPELILPIIRERGDFYIERSTFQPGTFCEKPHWVGWNFCILRRKE